MLTSVRFALAVGVAMSAAVVHAGPYDGWKPHAYCNDLNTMDATKIEPLTSEQADLVESLEQVQVGSCMHRLLGVRDYCRLM